ncbi:C4-dicarboxylate ABC transporter, partial [Halorubrum sp. E3]
MGHLSRSTAGAAILAVAVLVLVGVAMTAPVGAVLVVEDIE